MKNFLVVTNRSKDPNEVIANRIKEYTENFGDAYHVFLAEVEKKQDKYKFTNPDSVSDEIDCVITIGGDGTLLQTVRDLMDIDKPFIGVNRGTLGYLSEVYPEDIEVMMKKLINDEYVIENRMMIEGSFNGKSSVALNDIVIRRNDGMVRISLNVNDRHLTSYYADGVIVSTPTGSTAYNLSAGGPIVEPGAEIIIITPMYPHTINTRPIVLSENDVISVEIADIRGNGLCCSLSFDGDMRCELKKNDKIYIKKSNRTTKILKLSDSSFIEVLKEKMGDNII